MDGSVVGASCCCGDRCVRGMTDELLHTQVTVWHGSAHQGAAAGAAMIPP